MDLHSFVYSAVLLRVVAIAVAVFRDFGLGLILNKALGLLFGCLPEELTQDEAAVTRAA